MCIQVRDFLAVRLLLSLVVGQDGLRQRHQVAVFEVLFFLERAVGAPARLNDCAAASKDVAHAGNVELAAPLLVVRVEVAEEEDNFETAVEAKPIRVI